MVIQIKTKTSRWYTTRRFLFLFCHKTLNNLIFMVKIFISKLLRMVFSLNFQFGYKKTPFSMKKDEIKKNFKKFELTANLRDNFLLKVKVCSNLWTMMQHKKIILLSSKNPNRLQYNNLKIQCSQKKSHRNLT